MDSNTELLVAVVVLVITIVVGVCIYRFMMGRYERITRRWAERNGFELLEWEHTTSPITAQAVTGNLHEPFLVRVVVQDQSGSKRSGWLKTGSSSFGMLSDKVEFLDDGKHDDPK